MNVSPAPDLWMRRELIPGYSYIVEPVAYFLTDPESDRVRPVGMTEANNRAAHNKYFARLDHCEANRPVRLLRAASVLEAVEQFRPDRCAKCGMDWLVDQDGGADWLRLILQRHEADCEIGGAAD